MPKDSKKHRLRRMSQVLVELPQQLLHRSLWHFLRCGIGVHLDLLDLRPEPVEGLLLHSTKNMICKLHRPAKPFATFLATEAVPV